MGKLPFQIGSLVFTMALFYVAYAHAKLFAAIACLGVIVAVSLILADVLYDVYVRRKR